MTEILRPVYEFRPIPGALRGDLRRYANGEWLPDDGETYDLAFISGFGAPICMYVEHSYQRNILWGWTTGHWSANEHRHPKSNPWHYVLREGETEWGGDWGSSQHLNHRAGDSGMSKLVSEHRCANGRSVGITRPSKHVLAGMVRDRETGIVLAPPESPACMYCGDVWRHAEVTS